MQGAHQPPLCLAPHVRSCGVEGQVILLDLRRGKYLGVPERHAASLGRLVAHWPALATSEEPLSDEVATKVTRPLFAQGLLATANVGASPSPTTSAVTTSLRASDRVDPVYPGFRATQRFVRSAARTALSLRFRSLHAIADVIASRRARTVLERAEVDAYLRPVASFEWLRPLIYTAREKCLFDSLTLLQYLAGEGLDATLVLGVKTRPFAAHAWMQLGDVVLNDREEHVRRFTPILVV